MGNLKYLIEKAYNLLKNNSTLNGDSVPNFIKYFVLIIHDSLGTEVILIYTKSNIMLHHICAYIHIYGSLKYSTKIYFIL